MQPQINQIHKLLLKNRKTIAVAESCSGGMLSSLLTETPGSSAYFILGVVAYHNHAKEKILGIPARLIIKYGAVSQEIAQRMAQNVRKLAKTDFGISITGIAGPGGGTLQKPVGTVFIAIAAKNKTFCEKFNFKGNRGQIRKQSVSASLKLLLSFPRKRESRKITHL